MRIGASQHPMSKHAPNPPVFPMHLWARPSLRRFTNNLTPCQSPSTPFAVARLEVRGMESECPGVTGLTTAEAATCELRTEACCIFRGRCAAHVDLCSLSSRTLSSDYSR